MGLADKLTDKLKGMGMGGKKKVCVWERERARKNPSCHALRVLRPATTRAARALPRLAPTPPIWPLA